MKAFIASMLMISATSHAITANPIKGNVNLSAIVNAKGEAKGIKGLLPVTVSGEVVETSLKFNGFAENTKCVEYGEEEIPSHPETAPCLKYETKWVPQVIMTAAKVQTKMTVGEVETKQVLETVMKVPEFCILNLKEETVMGEVKPASAPAALKLRPNCRAFAYTRIEEKNLKPKALKGYSMEGIVDVTLSLEFAPETLEIFGTESTPAKALSLDVAPGTMGDFGGYNTKIFKYFDRVILN